MSITITNSLTLRQYYHDYSAFVNKSERESAKSGKLSFADSTALKNAIRRLGEYNFKDSSDSDLTEKMQAFADIYNNTLDSAKKYSVNDGSLKQAIKNIKKLSEKNKSDLASYGITFDEKGYMKTSDSAPKNVSHEKFSKIFGKDSEYMKELYTCAKGISSKVDVALQVRFIILEVFYSLH